jgi:hypothetical protein
MLTDPHAFWRGNGVLRLGRIRTITERPSRRAPKHPPIDPAQNRSFRFLSLLSSPVGSPDIWEKKRVGLIDRVSSVQ